jgi:hypothetical protein
MNKKFLYKRPSLYIIAKKVRKYNFANNTFNGAKKIRIIKKILKRI